uniref:Unkown protein n=1 Tax=Riptortus pedestris TaxID=329032 RepID=R4WRD5_RIPPE|nr:unkown protein [Riptortus pedestris]
MRRLCGLLSSLAKGITVEASCFVFFFAFNVYSLGAQRLLVQKTCSPQDQPPIQELCNATQAIGQAAEINIVRNVLGEVLPGVVVFIAGAWRDATGLCRPLILFTFITQFLAVCAFLLQAVVWSLSPWISSVLESTLGGLSGGKQMINLAAICYISNRTTLENRTFRLTFFVVSMTAGLSLATALSGYILISLGYVYFFATIMFLYLIGMVMAFIFIKEEPSKLVKGTKWLNVSTLLIVFKPKPNRAVIWLMIINSWLIYTTQCGEMTIILYFLEKGFGLTVTNTAFFLAYLMTMNFLSTVALTPFLIKVLKWSDFTIGIVGNVLTIIAVVGIALTKSITLLYVCKN